MFVRRPPLTFSFGRKYRQPKAIHELFLRLFLLFGGRFGGPFWQPSGDVGSRKLSRCRPQTFHHSLVFGDFGRLSLVSSFGSGVHLGNANHDLFLALHRFRGWFWNAL